LEVQLSNRQVLIDISIDLVDPSLGVVEYSLFLLGVSLPFDVLQSKNVDFLVYRQKLHYVKSFFFESWQRQLTVAHCQLVRHIFSMVSVECAKQGDVVFGPARVNWKAEGLANFDVEFLGVSKCAFGCVELPNARNLCFSAGSGG
jgi:hypothetical protein